MAKVQTLDSPIQETNFDLQESSSKKLFWKIGLFELSIILCSIVMVMMSFQHGITGDDIVVNEYGKEILKFILGFGNYEYNYEHPLAKEFDRDLVIQYYGGLFSVICALFNKISPFPEFTTIHIFNALTGILAAWYAGRILRRYVSETAAILVVWMMFLAPFWLGNAMNNPKDTPFAAAFIASLYYIFRFIERSEHLTRKDILWVIISIACAINVRVGGILLIPYLFLFLGVSNYYKSNVLKVKTSLAQGLPSAILCSVIAYLGSSLIWPSAIVSPLSHPIDSLNVLTNFPVSLNQLWEGKKIMSAELPWNYVPKAIFITSPFFFLVGFLLLTPLALLLYKQKKSYTYFFLLCLAFAAIFPIAYILYKKSNTYHLWRHTLFVFPIMATLAAFGYDYFARAYGKNIGYAVIGLAALLSIEPLLFTLKTMPNTMTYFNASVGGTNKAYGQYEYDFYYNSVKEASDWFLKNELPKAGKDTVILATNAAHIVGEYFKSNPKVKVQYVRFYQRNEAKYDYSLFHIAMIPDGNLRTGSWAKGNHVIYKAMHEGHPMCAVIKKPSNEDSYAQDSLKSGNVSAALSLMQAYAAKDPYNELNLNQLCDLYLQNNQADQAYPWIQKLMEIDSTSDEAMSSLGKYYVQKNEGAKAIAMWEKKCREELGNMRAYLELGLAQASIGQVELAIQNLNTSASDPRIAPMAYSYMARIYQQMGNMAEAQKYQNAAQQAAQGR
jgi:hypothetical protein